jgi:hypothetical protein
MPERGNMTSFNMLFYAAVLGYYLLIAASGAMAAEIKAGDTAPYDDPKEIQIVGPVEPGDYDKFEEIVRKAGPSYGHVILMSQGGDVVEAMKIGLLIRKLRFETETPEIINVNGLPTVSVGCRLAKIEETGVLKGTRGPTRNPNCRCFSACFLIHAAGVTRRGSYLGIHRPYIHPERLMSLSDTKIEKGMKNAKNVVRNYLIDMNIPRDIINIMMEQSSKNIHILTDSQFRRVQGDVPFLEELKFVSCKDLSPDEEGIYKSLSKKSVPPDNSPDGKRKSQELQELTERLEEKLGFTPEERKELKKLFGPARTEAEQKMFELLDQKRERYIRCGSDLRKEISKKAFSTWTNK